MGKLEQLIKERKMIYSKLNTIRSPIVKKFMQQDLKKIDEDIKVWRVRRKYINFKVIEKEEQ